jgi:hypothetical protein
VNGIQTRLADGITVADQAAQLSAAASQVRAGLAEVDGRIADVQGQIGEVQSRLEEASDRFGNLLGIGAILVALFGLYLAGLNVLLFQQGRRWQRGAPDTSASPDGGG